jgi:hypothetical protein
MAVRIKRCTWLAISAQAKQGVLEAVNTEPARSKNPSRSSLSLKIALRSIPRTMTWCNAPGASILALRGISTIYHNKTLKIRILIY